MEYAIYKGSVVVVEERQGIFSQIKIDEENMIVENKDLVPVPNDIAEGMINDLAAVKAKIAETKNRMYRLETEYTKKMNALREIYMDIRREELLITNKLLNSHYICQNNTY